MVISNQNFYLNRRTENKIYYYGIRNSEGKISWHSTGTRIKSEALRIVRDLNQPPKQEEKKTGLVFAEFMKMFNTSHSMNVNSKTSKSYDWVTREFQSICGNKVLTDYTPFDFETFKQRIMDRKITPFSVNHYLQNIKTVFQFAKNYDFLEKNPAEKLQKCIIPEQKPLFFNRDEINKLFSNTPDGVMKDIFVTAYYSGCRQAEILNLTWDCIDWERKIIRIQNTETFTTKTKRERSIPIHAEIEKILVRRREGSKCKYVFTKNTFWKYQGCYVSRCFKDAVKKAELNPKLHFHCLRHSFASSLSQAGVPIFSISKLLGHSQVSTTQRYAHLDTAQLSESISRL